MNDSISEIDRRLGRVTVSLLENERLTDGLDDPAADALLEWGLDWARDLVLRTAGMDRAQAEDFLAPRLKGIRKLLRRVNRWAYKRQALNLDQWHQLVSDVLEQTALVYDKVTDPGASDRLTLLCQSMNLHGQEPIQMIAGLRGLTENIVNNWAKELADQDSEGEHGN